jgi:hypothetical protein
MKAALHSCALSQLHTLAMFAGRTWPWHSEKRLLASANITRSDGSRE